MVRKIDFDTPEYRKNLNRIAEELKLPYRFTETDKDAPGIQAKDIYFLDHSIKFFGKPMFKIKLNVLSRITPSLKQSIQDVLSTLEKRRRELIEKDLDPIYGTEVSADIDLSGLPQPSQVALNHFMEIAKYTTLLRLLQRDLKGESYLKQISDPSSRRHAVMRYSFAGCDNVKDNPFCSPQARYVTQDPNTSLWPDSIDSQKKLDQFLAKLSEPERKKVMSNYSVVVEQDGKLKGIPYTEYAPYRPLLKKIQTEFTAISKIEGFDSAVRKQALAYAKALSTSQKDRFRPFDDAEVTWVNPENRSQTLAFSWGPFEEGFETFRVKREFQFSLLAIDQKAEEVLLKSSSLVGELNRVLKSRGVNFTVNSNQQLPLVQTGYSLVNTYRIGRANPMAQTIPNDTEHISGQNFNRRVDIDLTMVKGVFDLAIKPVGDTVIHPDQRRYVNLESVKHFVTLHELSHSSGVACDYKITKDGKVVSIAEATGGKSMFVEEGKGNTGGMSGFFLLKNSDGSPMFTKEEQKAGYTTYVAGLFRQIRYGKNIPHGALAMSELGNLIKEGAVTVKKYSDRKEYIYINYDKMPAALLNFYVGAVKTQLSGSKEVIGKFISDNQSHVPNKFFDWIDMTSTTSRVKGIPNGVMVKIPESTL